MTRIYIKDLAKTLTKGQYSKKRYINVRDQGNHYLVWTNEITMDGNRVENHLCSILK